MIHLSCVDLQLSLTCGLLDEDHIGDLVPGVLVHGKSAVSARAERPLLAQESSEARTSGTAIGPQHKGTAASLVQREQYPTPYTHTLNILPTSFSTTLLTAVTRAKN